MTKISPWKLSRYLLIVLHTSRKNCGNNCLKLVLKLTRKRFNGWLLYQQYGTHDPNSSWGWLQSRYLVIYLQSTVTLYMYFVSKVYFMSNVSSSSLSFVFLLYWKLLQIKSKHVHASKRLCAVINTQYLTLLCVGRQEYWSTSWSLPWSQKLQLCMLKKSKFLKNPCPAMNTNLFHLNQGHSSWCWILEVSWN